MDSLLARMTTKLSQSVQYTGVPATRTFRPVISVAVLSMEA